MSTVHGNAPMSKVTHNALSILTSIGAPNIPVYAGAAKPFMRPAIHAPAIHGESGIDGTLLLPVSSATIAPGNAIVAMYEALIATPAGTAVLVATGTLTNIALLFAVFPDVVGHIKHLSIMGGAFGTRPDSHGNIAKEAEFNVFCDPESARSVLNHPELSGKVTLVPLDLTHTVLARTEVLDRLQGDGGNLRTMLTELLVFFTGAYEKAFGRFEGPPLHDPLAVAVVLGGEELGWEWESVGVSVCCDGEDVGRTVKTVGGEVREAALGGHGEEAMCKVRIPVKLDVAAFWEVMLRMVDRVDGRYTWPV